MFHLRNRLLSTALLLVGATLVLSLGVALVGRTLQVLDLHNREARLQQDLETLETRRRALVRLTDAASSDAYVEQVAREQLGLVKPGEIGVVVHTPPVVEAEVIPLPGPRPDLRTNWERWRDWLLRH